MAPNYVSSEEDSPPSPPRARRHRARVDLCAGDGPGAIDWRGPLGEWRSVPGFDPDRLRVSADGNVQTHNGIAWTPPTPGTRQYKHAPPGQTYRIVSIENVTYLVHMLVCRAFHGPRPSSKHECARQSASCEDNRAEVLAWAPRALGPRGAQTASALSLRLRHPEHTNGAWTSHRSALAARRAFAHAVALDPLALGRAARGLAAETHGFEVRLDDGVETQDDLPAEADAPPEEWREHPQSEGRLRVSNRGRVQLRANRNGCWGLKRTPLPSRKSPEPTVVLNGRRLPAAQLQREAFGAR